MLIGAAATLLAGLVVVIFRALWKSSPKMVWFFESDRVELNFDKTKSQHCYLWRVTMENIGRGTAKRLELFVPDKIQSFRARRVRRTWLFLSTTTLLSNDLSVEIEDLPDRSKVVIRDVEKNSIVDLTYVTESSRAFGPEALHSDGKIVDKINSSIWFSSENDALLRIAIAKFPPLFFLAVALIGLGSLFLRNK